MQLSTTSMTSKGAAALGPTERLSPRQRQVLEGILAGKPNKVIAHGLGLSTRTVEAHRAAIMVKIGVSSVVELVQLTAPSGQNAGQNSGQNAGQNRDPLEIIAQAYPGFVSFWDKDLIGRFAHAPREWNFGNPVETVVGRSIKDVLGPYLYNLSAPYIQGALQGEPQQFRQIWRKANGALAVYCASYAPHFDAQGKVDGFFEFSMDMSAFEGSFGEDDDSPEMRAAPAQMILNGEGTILAVNQSFTRVTRYKPDEALGRTHLIIKPAGVDAAAYMTFWRKVMDDGFWQGAVWYRRRDGYLFRCRQTISLDDERGETEIYKVSFKEVTIPFSQSLS
jgi:PAS domain S-box-containing protein